MVELNKGGESRFDFVGKGKCILIKGNPSLGNVLVYPNGGNSQIIFDVLSLGKFCSEACNKRENCKKSTRRKILNLMI